MTNIKKYKADSRFTKTQGNGFVQQNTLLEPNNEIPSWEFGGEERKEVSNTMRKLKHQFDETYRTRLEKEKELERLRSQLEQANNDEENLGDKNYRTSYQIDSTQTDLDGIIEKHNFEQMLQGSYHHMLDRMQRDLIAYQIQSNERLDSFRSKQQILEEETEKNRSAKQEKTQNHKQMRDQIKQIALDYRQRQDRHNSLEKSIANKTEAIKRRELRVKKQQIIAESAASENRNSDELSMRDNFLAQRIWSAFMKTKMEREMKRTLEIENAFQHIRAATGHSDV